MLRKCLLIVLFLILSSGFSIAHAADFKFDYDTFYTVAQSGKTQVKLNIILTNLTSQLYARDFILNINSVKLENVEAADPDGKTNVELSQNNGQTQIKLTFKTSVVGVDQKLPFTLNYTSDDIANKLGRVWEVIIPGIEPNPNINSYNIHLNVPVSFGKPAFISPVPKTDNIWSLKEHQGKGIRVTYGDYQTYRFTINYHLDNQNEQETTDTITLIPDTAFQKVVLARLSPLPQNVYLDKDDNWLAEYPVNPGKNLSVTAEGYIKVFAKPGKNTGLKLSPEDIQVYTRSMPFWDQSEDIKAQAQKLKDTRSIYNWVSQNLTYDYNRVKIGNTRIGAAQAILHPESAVCTEFADLFVTLARANKIPARELQGYAYTVNSRLQPLSLTTDVLHAWVEYYSFDQSQWLPVDPTWGNTTRGADYFTQLDFNHVVFAILGEKSDYPYPAGSFKNDNPQKDVFIDFFPDELKIPDTKIIVDWNLPANIYSGIRQTGIVKIINSSQVFSPAKAIVINGDIPIKLTRSDVKPLPPFGFDEMPIELMPSLSFKTKDVILTASISGEKYSKTVTISPLWQHYVIITGLCIVLGIIVLSVILRFHGHRRT